MALFLQREKKRDNETFSRYGDNTLDPSLRSLGNYNVAKPKVVVVFLISAWVLRRTTTTQTPKMVGVFLILIGILRGPQKNQLRR